MSERDRNGRDARRRNPHQSPTWGAKLLGQEDQDEACSQDQEDPKPRRRARRQPQEGAEARETRQNGGGGPRDRQADAKKGSPLSEGLRAMRQVREASRQHADARGQLAELTKAVEADQAELTHRQAIEGSFETVVSQQESIQAEARAALVNIGASIDQLQADQDALEAQLRTMKAEHEESLRPYRNLMEAAKGRSDDAARALSDIRRSVKTADQQVADAAKRREQRIAAANKAVDNGQNRLRKVQTELDALQADANADPTALSKMQSELVAEQAHLDAAREEVTRVTAEAQQLVTNAQTHLWTQKQSQETLERQASDAKAEATQSREEYEALYNNALGKEKALQDQIDQKKKGIQDAQKAAAAAQDHIGQAQAALDEAHQIHETPERTAELARAVDENTVQLNALKRDVARLAQRERNLRSRTRGKRVLLIVLLVLVVVVIAVVAFLVTQGIIRG